MNDFAGRVAVVTGGGSGIGRGMALGFAEAGMRLALLDLNGPAAEQVAGEIRSRGGEASAHAVDVTSSDALAAAAKEVEKGYGGVNVVCANAGVMLPLGRLSEKTDDDWEYVFSVNVHGVVRTVNAFLPLLRAADEAHIVNTASLGGVVAVPEIPIGVYVASKYAVVGYSECLRYELGHEGIGVSVLCPGVVESDLYNTSARNRPDRYGGPEEVTPPGELAGARPPPKALPAEEVGPIVLRAIRDNRLHIFTHAAARPLAEARFETIGADFAAAALERRG